MPNRWKGWLLEAYYQTTRLDRIRNLRRLAASGSAPVMSVFYHRVANEHPNPWTISEGTFASHLKWMADHLEFVSLAEAQKRIRLGNSTPCVSITFDDGYADNMRFAIPLLLEKKIPFTYFVCAGNISRDEHFPHDLARGIPLAVNTIDDIRAIADQGVEIGAHTRWHTDLGQPLAARQLYDELVIAAADLQVAIERPIRYFAFPYGQHCNLSPQAFELAFETGFEGVVTAYGGYNFPGEDAFHLQRIPGDTELVYLKNWLTLDPRKLASTRRYQYQRYRLPASTSGAAAL